jgi:hypothetical protein
VRQFPKCDAGSALALSRCSDEKSQQVSSSSVLYIPVRTDRLCHIVPGNNTIMTASLQLSLLVDTLTPYSLGDTVAPRPMQRERDKITIWTVRE